MLLGARNKFSNKTYSDSHLYSKLRIGYNKVTSNISTIACWAAIWTLKRQCANVIYYISTESA
jgi:hypothetical protein